MQLVVLAMVTTYAQLPLKVLLYHVLFRIHQREILLVFATRWLHCRLWTTCCEEAILNDTETTIPSLVSPLCVSTMVLLLNGPAIFIEKVSCFFKGSVWWTCPVLILNLPKSFEHHSWVLLCETPSKPSKSVCKFLQFRIEPEQLTTFIHNNDQVMVFWWYCIKYLLAHLLIKVCCSV